MGSDGESLIGLWFDGQKYFGDTLTRESIERDLSVFEETRLWLDNYFKGIPPTFTPPLRMSCTEFRKDVWEKLLSIPFGSTMTYGQIAKDIAVRRNQLHMSSQAIGGAVSHNPISIIVPCHRVIGANGEITGYAGGVDKKSWLLNHEKSAHK